MMTSPDGITWTARNAGGTEPWKWYAVTYTGRIFVAVGNSNRVMTSYNGITWTIIAAATDSNWRGVVSYDNFLVAVAYWPPTTTQVMTSDTLFFTTTDTFTSQPHSLVASNTPMQTYFGYINYTASLYAGTSAYYYVQHASATTANFTSWTATTDYLLISSTDTVWKYKIDVTASTNTVAAPIIYNVALNFKTTGYWETPEVNTTGMSDWGTFSANSTLDSAASLTYGIYVATFSGGTATASSSALTSGATISTSTGAYTKVRATDNFTTATETVKLHNLQFSWNIATDKMSNAFEYKGNIYFGVPYASSLTNNRLLKFDIEKAAWYPFDIAVNSPMSIDEYVFFGSPTSGYLYRYPLGDSDNTAAINSYWKSKNYIGGNPYVEKTFQRLSIIAGSSYGSNLAVTYTMDTATSTAYTINLTSNTATFVRNNRNLQLGGIGTFFNLQVGNNATNQPWKFFGASVDYADDPWRVLPE